MLLTGVPTGMPHVPLAPLAPLALSTARLLASGSVCSPVFPALAPHGKLFLVGETSGNATIHTSPVKLFSMTTIEHEPELVGPPKDQEKVRQCLHCRDTFTSHWYGERVCRRCKSHSFWRESGGAVLEL